MGVGNMAAWAVVQLDPRPVHVRPAGLRTMTATVRVGGGGVGGCGRDQGQPPCRPRGDAEQTIPIGLEAEDNSLLTQLATDWNVMAGL